MATPTASAGDPGAADAVTVRALGPADLAAVTALDARVTGRPKADYWRRLFAAWLPAGPARCAFVAERGGALVGYAMGEVRSWEFGSEPCGWVFALNVAPEAREAGIGARLFDALCAAFRAAGVGRVRTMVAREATVLLSFFRAQGMSAGPFLELEKPLGGAGGDYPQKISGKYVQD